LIFVHPQLSAQHPGRGHPEPIGRGRFKVFPLAAARVTTSNPTRWACRCCKQAGISVEGNVKSRPCEHRPKPRGAPMSVFERYLTVWVFLCIVVGIALGQLLPGVFQAIGRMEVAQVNLPVGLLIWVMIIPMLVKVDFGALHEVRQHMRGIGVTLFVNWLVKPFSMAFLGWLFIRHCSRPGCRPTSSTATSPA
jgi:hypothetical protein